MVGCIIFTDNNKKQIDVIFLEALRETLFISGHWVMTLSYIYHYLSEASRYTITSEKHIHDHTASNNSIDFYLFLSSNC